MRIREICSGVYGEVGHKRKKEHHQDSFICYLQKALQEAEEESGLGNDASPRAHSAGGRRRHGLVGQRFSPIQIQFRTGIGALSPPGNRVAIFTTFSIVSRL